MTTTRTITDPLRRAGLALTLLVVACGPTEPDECLSGSAWTGGNEESPLMNPGEACIACHQAEDEGPEYTFAGTVYEGLDEPNDCNGLSGATVEVIDADGASFTATTNSAGNFFLNASDLVFPVTATVTDGTRTATMVTAQASGDCNTCHSAAGSDGAPGRIALQ